MNYESSWQECLQLWGSQNGPVNDNCNYTKTLDIIPNAVDRVNGMESFVFDSTNSCTSECATLCTGNEIVASHSFNYINNFAHNQCNPTESADQGVGGRLYGRQRCCPQMLGENQMLESTLQNGISTCEVSYPTSRTAASCPLAESYNHSQMNGMDNWVIPPSPILQPPVPPQSPPPPPPPPPLSNKIENSVTSNGYGVDNNYNYKNQRKLYRTPTMLEKSIGLPYIRESAPDFAFNVELSSNRVPVADPNGFLIPRPKLIVPVHTYGSRKRRTGNILHSKRRGSDSEPATSSSTTLESKKHHTSCPGKILLYLIQSEFILLGWWLSIVGDYFYLVFCRSCEWYCIVFKIVVTK